MVMSFKHPNMNMNAYRVLCVKIAFWDWGTIDKEGEELSQEVAKMMQAESPTLDEQS